VKARHNIQRSADEDVKVLDKYIHFKIKVRKWVLNHFRFPKEPFSDQFL